MIWIAVSQYNGSKQSLVQSIVEFLQMPNNLAENIRLIQMMSCSQSGEFESYEAFDRGGLVECLTPKFPILPPAC